MADFVPCALNSEHLIVISFYGLLSSTYYLLLTVSCIMHHASRNVCHADASVKDMEGSGKLRCSSWSIQYPPCPAHLRPAYTPSLAHLACTHGISVSACRAWTHRMPCRTTSCHLSHSLHDTHLTALLLLSALSTFLLLSARYRLGGPPGSRASGVREGGDGPRGWWAPLPRGVLAQSRGSRGGAEGGPAAGGALRGGQASSSAVT